VHVVGSEVAADGNVVPLSRQRQAGDVDGSIFCFVVEYPDRLYDIRNAYQPAEVGACVPPAPKKLMGPRPNRPVVLHSADVFVDKNGIVYCADWSGAGLHIMEYRG
jgi:hypothetical protein